MKYRISFFAGLLVLCIVWAGPFATLAKDSFASHMVMHMGVVAIAAPLLSYGLVPYIRTRPKASIWFNFPVPASLFDLVVIWGWHTPAAHEAARLSPAVKAMEQTAFLIVGLFLWLTVLVPSGSRRYLSGAGALLFTSMHMTLLGVLLGLMPNPICNIPTAAPPFNWTIIEDQQIGGFIMLAVGGIVYVVAGLFLIGKALHEASSRENML